MKFSKLLLAVVSAVLLLSALAATASAGRFVFSEQGLRVLYERLEFIGAFGTTECPLTLEGSFHSRTLVKVAETLVGYITRAILGRCIVGSATILTETLPWHKRYESFVGTLPTITSIRTRIVGFSWRVREPGGITCNVRTTAAEPLFRVYSLTGAPTTITRSELTGEIRTGAECFGARGRLRATTTKVGTLLTLARITVTLI